MTVSLTQDKITKIKTLPSSLLDNSFCVNREVAYWSPNFQFTRCQVWSPVLQKFRNEQSCCSEEAQRGNKLTTWCNNSCYMYNGNNGLMNSCLEWLVRVTLCNATCNRLFISSDNVRLHSKPFNHDTLNMWSENVSDHFGTFVISYQMSSIFVCVHKLTEFDRLKSKAASDINVHCWPLECSLKASWPWWMLPRIEVIIIDQQKVPNLTCKQRNLDCSTFARIIARELKIEWEHLFQTFLS